MRQYAYTNFFGIVGHIKDNPSKNSVSICLLVNRADSHNLHTGKKEFYISIFDGAYKTIIPYIKVGDSLEVKDCDIYVDYEKKGIFFNVRQPWQLFLVAAENRLTLQSRTDLGNSDPSSLGDFDNV